MTPTPRTKMASVLLGWCICLTGCAQWTPPLESYDEPLPSAHATPVAIPQRMLNATPSALRSQPSVVRQQSPDPQSPWNGYTPVNPNQYQSPVVGTGPTGTQPAQSGGNATPYQRGAQAWGVTQPTVGNGTSNPFRAPQAPSQ